MILEPFLLYKDQESTKIKPAGVFKQSTVRSQSHWQRQGLWQDVPTADIIFWMTQRRNSSE